MPLLLTQVGATTTEVMLLLLVLLLLGLPTSAATRQTCPQVRGFMAAGRTVRLLVLVPHFLTLLRHFLLRMMSGTQISSLLNTDLLLLLVLLLLRLTRLASPAIRFLLEEPLHQLLT